tara:strand:+ start:632 stop:766 length:135 start_codon:yes stop_codon:yes gene_type:complete
MKTYQYMMGLSANTKSKIESNLVKKSKDETDLSGLIKFHYFDVT